jgi:RHS repeat-associated protein
VTIVGLGTTATLTGLENGTSYTFVVRARNAVGLGAESAPSAAVLPASAPSAPSDLVASAASREAILYWTAPAADGGSALTGYRIAVSPGGLSLTVPGDRTFARVTGLDDAVPYRFTIVAANAQGDGPVSAPSDEVIPFGPPGAPGGIQGTRGNGTALVRWSAPGSDGGRAVTGYTVTAEPGGLTAAAPAGETSRLITGLANGTAYTLQVTATNLAGAGPASALSGTVIPLTVPDPPTDAQATGGDATATVTWLAPATDGGSPISRYVVVSYPGDKQVVVDGGVLQATVDGLTNGTPYVFTVRAVNAEGRGPESIRSNYVIPVGAPNAPTNVLAVVGGLATARVTWSASSNNGGSSITTYTVTASPGGRAVTAIGTATAAVVNNLTVGTAYTFTVAATNRIGTGPASQPSNSFVAATVPGAPTNVIAVEEVGGVRVTWTPPASDGFTPIRLYQIFINPFGSDTAKLVGGTTTSLSIGGFPLGVPLSFVVQAINDVGAGPGSVVSNSVTLAKPPGAPGNVTAAADGNAGARVTWTAAASNGAPITNYTVISTPGSLTATVDGTATSATVSGLTVGTTYTFTVTATNRKGAGPASAPSNPVAITGTPPKAEILTPTDGTEITSPTQIVGTATATGFRDYVLEIAPAGESTFTTIARGTAPVAGGVLGTLDPTLLLNDLYTVRLTVFATSGASANTSTSYAVGGGMKVGNFTLSFEDLTVPLSGLPITVVRNYDSRDKRSGDFGYGWTLALRQGSYRNNRKPGLGWEIESGFLPCQRVQELASHATVIRLSDQEIYRFRLNLGSPAPTIGGCFADARFDFVDGPVPGATLTILGDTQVFYQNDTSEVVDTDTFDVFEPRQVRLTTRDGRIFDLELQKGVTRLQDLNGNTLLIGSSGITHSSGRSISFARDGAGRITSITDPMGKSFTYTYDAAGDLIAVTDRSDQTTTFIYDGNHRVLTIEDPRGIQPIRNEYDADGRLIRQIDAFGKAIEYDHELAANQEIVTDRLGHSRLMEYDDRGNVVREVDSLGNETQRTFDDRDNMISVTDPLDATTTYTYDANDNQTSVTDALGHRTTLTFDALGHARTVIGPRGDVNLHDFDDNGNLLSLSNPLGHRIDYQYDEQGEISAETDPVGGITVYEHDTFGNVTRETDPAGHATRYTYDANGNQLAKSTTRTTASGAETLTWVYGYDALGRLVSTTDPDGTSSLQIYDALDHVAERIDKLGRHTTFTYDEMGRLVSTGYADGTSEQSVFDAEGRQTSSTDRGGRTTRFEYDALGRLIRTVYPDDTAETKDYDAAGRLVTLTDARGNATRFEYDRVGRRTKVIDALGHETSFAYDESGNRVAMTDALGRTTRYVYDLANREVQVLFPDGTSRETAYDEAGHKISEIDQARKITRYEYDPLGRLVKVTDALGQTTRYTYDELGDLTRQTDANNHTTELEYDALRRLVRRTLPLGTAETIAYDAAGNPIRRTDFNGATTTYTYDEGNRLTSRTYPDGSSVSFTYNAVGRRTEVIDSRGTTRYEYDVRDRMTRLIDPADRSLEFVYDESGNRASLNAQIGATTWSTASSYDSLNRLAAVTDPQGLTYRIAYDELGNRAEVNYPNGLTTTYRYDIRNHLTDVETRSGSGALLQSFHYTLGPAGNRLRVDEQDGAARLYAYDGLYRLIRETVSGAASYQEEFTYDAVGNRLSQVKTVASGATTTLLYSYDERDRMLSAAGTTYSWDQNGQMQTRSGTDGATYTWSFDGRLTQVLEANGRVTTYAYDADGNRVRTEITPANGPPNVTEYLVDPSGALSQVVAEIDGSRNLTAYYVRGDDLLAVLRPGSIRFFHADGLGSIRALSDESGVLTDTYSFSAFGELLSHVGADVNTYLFAGEPLDPNSGFYHLRARWMDPAAGRFASSDPMEGTLSEPASLHRYLYAFLDPTDRTDPSGLYSIFTYLGTAVHNHIIDEFRGQGPGRTGDEPISTVLRFYRSLPCTGIGCAREPDLVHVGKRSIYEIKPATRGHFIAGFLQIVDLYLPTLHRNDPSGGWWIGDNSNYEPPPPFTLWSQGYLWVIFVAPPIEGVVLYSEVNLTDPRIIRNVRAASKRAIDSFIKRYLQIKQQGEEAQLKANNEQIALSAQLKF